MCKVDIKNGDTRIDPCMKDYVRFLGCLGLKVKASCCGHKVYSRTVVVEGRGLNDEPINYELFTGKIIQRKSRFYKRNKNGIYFIPEVQNEKIKTKGRKHS